MAQAPVPLISPIPGTQPGTQPGITKTISSNTDSTYKWVLAWLLIILIGAVLLQTEIGYRIVYYGLILLLVFLFVTQYQFIATSLAPIGESVPA